MLVCKSLRLNMQSFLKGTFPSVIYVDSSLCYYFCICMNTERAEHLPYAYSPFEYLSLQIVALSLARTGSSRAIRWPMGHLLSRSVLGTLPQS